MMSYPESTQELATILITSFQALSERERFILSNNTFMVANQIKTTYGDAIEEKIKTFTNEDWRSAWGIFDGHFADEEGENDEEI